MIVLDDEHLNGHTKVRNLLVVTSIPASLILTYI
jgi:hypothetical protein